MGKLVVTIHGFSIGRQRHAGLRSCCMIRITRCVATGRKPYPNAAFTDVQHGKHAQNQQGAAGVNHRFPGRTGHLKNTGLHLREVLQHKRHRCWVNTGVAE